MHHIFAAFELTSLLTRAKIASRYLRCPKVWLKAKLSRPNFLRMWPKSSKRSWPSATKSFPASETISSSISSNRRSSKKYCLQWKPLERFWSIVISFFIVGMVGVGEARNWFHLDLDLDVLSISFGPLVAFGTLPIKTRSDIPWDWWVEPQRWRHLG